VTEEDIIRQQARLVEEEKIRQARAMSPAEKFLAGAELFEEACERSLAGIRHRNPEFTEEQAKDRLRELIAMMDPQP
jgi:hypothetical protein